MLIPFPIFISRFPYVQFKEINLFKGKTIYEKYTMGGNHIDAKEKRLIRDNQNLLLENGVPINKVRFVFEPIFTYDIDKNTINPVYHVMLPINGNNRLFAKEEPVIEIGKPKNLITISVGNYCTDDNYAYLKKILKRSKKGVVIFIADEKVNDLFTGAPTPYKFSVDCEVIRFANLDAAVDSVESFNTHEL
jgi:hypothetical protein